MKSDSEVAQSCPTLSDPVGFSRQEYWSGVPLPSPEVNAIADSLSLGSSKVTFSGKN